METAVGRIVVLRFAGGTHHKTTHGGAGTVVGDVQRDGETGPALGAIDERVAEPAIEGVTEFA